MSLRQIFDKISFAKWSDMCVRELRIFVAFWAAAFLSRVSFKRICVNAKRTSIAVQKWMRSVCIVCAIERKIFSKAREKKTPRNLFKFVAEMEKICTECNVQYFDVKLRPWTANELIIPKMLNHIKLDNVVYGWMHQYYTLSRHYLTYLLQYANEQFIDIMLYATRCFDKFCIDRFGQCFTLSRGYNARTC